MTESDTRQRRWLIGHLVLLAAAAVVLVIANRGQWFFGDEWEFFVNRGIFHAGLGLFKPHNEHWSTVPILVYVGLRNTVGLVSYWPYIGVLIAVHLTLTHLLWRIMLRCGALPLVATATAAVFSVLGAGAENLLWAFQIGFVGAVAFGWAGALVAATRDRRPGWRDLWAVLLLIAALMCAGIAVPMVAAAAVAVLITSRSLWRPLIVGGVPAVVFLVWYVLMGRRFVHSGEKHTLRSIVSVVGRGLADMTTSATGAPRLIALVLIVALAAWCGWAVVRVVRNTPGSSDVGLALGGVVAIAVFTVMVAVGRGGLAASRYLYIVVAMALPAVSLGLSAVARRRAVQVIAVLLLLVIGVHNVQMLRARASLERSRESWTRDVIESAGRLIEEGTPAVGNKPEPVYDPDITVQALKTMVERNMLPTNATSPRGELGARLWLQVAVVAPDSGPASEPAAVSDQVLLDPVAGQDGCFVPAAGVTSGSLVMQTDGSVRSLRLRSDGDEDAQYQIQLGSGSTQPPIRLVSVPAGSEMEVLTNLPADAPDLAIRPTTHDSAVCLTP